YYLDGSTAFTVTEVIGTAGAGDPTALLAAIPDYIPLARLRITAGATAVTTAMIDDLRPPWMVALGGILPIKDVADRDTLTPYPGMPIWRLDKKWTETHDGTAWRVTNGVTCAALADITHPLTGQLAFLSTDLQLYRYSGSAWVTMAPYFHGYQENGATQPITATVAAAITMTGEHVDNINGHDPAVNSHRYTPSVPGTYECSGMLALDGALATGSGFNAQFRKNGVVSLRGPYNGEFAQSQGFIANTAIAPTVSFAMNGTTDWIALYGNCGVNTSTFANAADMGSYMIIKRVGP
ncbi:MAG: hypothetical protein ABIQ18_41205, partial [Umezawaea sp.]